MERTGEKKIKVKRRKECRNSKKKERKKLRKWKKESGRRERCREQKKKCKSICDEKKEKTERWEKEVKEARTEKTGLKQNWKMINRRKSGTRKRIGKSRWTNRTNILDG